jgi:preprotein translocase subunit SecG
VIYVLYVLEVIVCLFLILVVLLQQGSGADLSVFGGGATQTAFGARGTTQFIHKLTVWAFIGFILLTLAIAVYQGGASSSSVITGANAKELSANKPKPAATVPASAPVQAVPVTPQGTAPAAPPAQAPAPAQQAPAPAPTTP